MKKMELRKKELFDLNLTYLTINQQETNQIISKSDDNCHKMIIDNIGIS